MTHNLLLRFLLLLSFLRGFRLQDHVIVFRPPPTEKRPTGGTEKVCPSIQRDKRWEKPRFIHRDHIFPFRVTDFLYANGETARQPYWNHRGDTRRHPHIRGIFNQRTWVSDKRLSTLVPGTLNISVRKRSASSQPHQKSDPKEKHKDSLDHGVSDPFLFGCPSVLHPCGEKLHSNPNRASAHPVPEKDLSRSHSIH